MLCRPEPFKSHSTDDTSGVQAAAHEVLQRATEGLAVEAAALDDRVRRVQAGRRQGQFRSPSPEMRHVYDNHTVDESSPWSSHRRADRPGGTDDEGAGLGGTAELAAMAVAIDRRRRRPKPRCPETQYAEKYRRVAGFGPHSQKASLG